MHGEVFVLLLTLLFGQRIVAWPRVKGREEGIRESDKRGERSDTLLTPLYLSLLLYSLTPLSSLPLSTPLFSHSSLLSTSLCSFLLSLLSPLYLSLLLCTLSPLSSLPLSTPLFSHSSLLSTSLYSSLLSLLSLLYLSTPLFYYISLHAAKQLSAAGSLRSLEFDCDAIARTIQYIVAERAVIPPRF